MGSFPVTLIDLHSVYITQICFWDFWSHNRVTIFAMFLLMVKKGKATIFYINNLRQ